MSIAIQRDSDGSIGRECPSAECEGYFKIVPGTGLQGGDLPCHCPYCGHTAQHDHFWTQDQIEYARSAALHQVGEAIHRDLKSLEFSHKPRGAFGIGVSMKVKRGRPIPIHHYREKRLETDVVCVNCTLRYSVYGVFAFCPDCGEHNSLQILEKSLDVVSKMIDLSGDIEQELSEKLIENALEDCVSAFDGCGRELCRVHASRALDAEKAQRVSFQDLLGARKKVIAQFSVDLATPLAPGDWDEAANLFQKRHLVAHKLGVVDQDYVDKTGDAQAVVGRKVPIGASEVNQLANHVRAIARGLSASLLDAAGGPDA